MNFDDMQAAWNKDSGSKIEIPQRLSSLKNANSPIEKVKKHIRIEMWMNLTAMIVFILLPLFTTRLTSGSAILFYTLLLATLMPMGYYFSNFYKFYSRLNKNDLNTKTALDDAYFELKNNIEMYKVMQHFITPNLFIAGFIFGIGPKMQKLLDKLTSIKTMDQSGILMLCILILTFIVFMVGFYFYIRWHVNFLYGKYLKELGQIRDELAAE